MAAAFFLMLREGLEAALIVGIIAAYLVKIDRRDGLRGVAIGVGAALALSAVVAVIVALTIERMSPLWKDTIEGVTAIFAVVVLTWMLFWMRRQGRAIKGELEGGIDGALASGSMLALAGLAFVAVAREGLETVLLLIAIGSSSGPALQTFVAAVAGLVVAIAIGYGIFALGVRIDLRRFFTITGVVLIFVAAGLLSFAVHEFVDAGLLPKTDPLFDLTGVLPDHSPLGSVLAGLFGYRAAPSPLEVFVYLAYLVPVLILFLKPPRRRSVSGPAAALTGALVIALLVAGCGSSSAAASPAGSGIPGAIRVGASEYAFDPATVTTPSGSTTFELVNSGSTEHEFQLLKGATVIGSIRATAPGKTGNVTVDLQAGDYTYVCKIAGHDALGMKGTLSVTGG